MTKRVLMTADTEGGVWTYALELSRSLAGHGVEVALATMGRFMPESFRREAQALDNVTLHESAFKLEWMENPWHDVEAAGRWLLDLRDHLHPDVVHLNGFVHGALPWQVPVLITGHSCVFSWWRAVNRTMPPPEWDAYRDKVRQGLHAATHVTAPSRAMLSSLQSIYGPLPNASVISNGRAAQSFHAAEKLPIVLSAGRIWDKAKNIASVAAVAPDLPWPAYIAGEGKGAFRRELNIWNLGYQASSGLAEWMAKASIFAAPAFYEPFGLTILEAALSGCALVLGDIESLKENWDGAAVFVPPSNAEALKTAITELIRHPDCLSAMALRATNRGTQFTAERMASSYAEIYESLCNSLCSITR
jgi:glycogen synthase